MLSSGEMFYLQMCLMIAYLLGLLTISNANEWHVDEAEAYCIETYPRANYNEIEDCIFNLTKQRVWCKARNKHRNNNANQWTEETAKQHCIDIQDPLPTVSPDFHELFEYNDRVEDCVEHLTGKRVKINWKYNKNGDHHTFTANSNTNNAHGSKWHGGPFGFSASGIHVDASGWTHIPYAEFSNVGGSRTYNHYGDHTYNKDSHTTTATYNFADGSTYTTKTDSRGNTDQTFTEGWGNPHSTYNAGMGDPHSTYNTGSGNPHSTYNAGNGNPHSTHTAGSGNPHSTYNAGSGNPHSTYNAGSGNPHSTNNAGMGSTRTSSTDSKGNTSNTNNYGKNNISTTNNSFDDATETIINEMNIIHTEERIFVNDRMTRFCGNEPYTNYNHQGLFIDNQLFSHEFYERVGIKLYDCRNNECLTSRDKYGFLMIDGRQTMFKFEVSVTKSEPFLKVDDAVFIENKFVDYGTKDFNLSIKDYSVNQSGYRHTGQQQRYIEVNKRRTNLLQFDNNFNPMNFGYICTGECKIDFDQDGHLIIDNFITPIPYESRMDVHVEPINDREGYLYVSGYLISNSLLMRKVTNPFSSRKQLLGVKEYYITVNGRITTKFWNTSDVRYTNGELRIDGHPFEEKNYAYNFSNGCSIDFDDNNMIIVNKRETKFRYEDGMDIFEKDNNLFIDNYVIAENMMSKQTTDNYKKITKGYRLGVKGKLITVNDKRVGFNWIYTDVSVINGILSFDGDEFVEGKYLFTCKGSCNVDYSRIDFVYIDNRKTKIKTTDEFGVLKYQLSENEICFWHYNEYVSVDYFPTIFKITPIEGSTYLMVNNRRTKFKKNMELVSIMKPDGNLYIDDVEFDEGMFAFKCGNGCAVDFGENEKIYLNKRKTQAGYSRNIDIREENEYVFIRSNMLIEEDIEAEMNNKLPQVKYQLGVRLGVVTVDLKPTKFQWIFSYIQVKDKNLYIDEKPFNEGMFAFICKKNCERTNDGGFLKINGRKTKKKFDSNTQIEEVHFNKDEVYLLYDDEDIIGQDDFVDFKPK